MIHTHGHICKSMGLISMTCILLMQMHLQENRGKMEQMVIAAASPQHKLSTSKSKMIRQFMLHTDRR